MGSGSDTAKWSTSCNTLADVRRCKRSRMFLSYHAGRVVRSLTVYLEGKELSLKTEDLMYKKEEVRTLINTLEWDSGIEI